MAKSQVDIEAQVIELATDSFNTFCEDISGMFGVSMKCVQKEVVTEDVAGLKQRFSRLVAVNVVDSKGSIEGTFHVLFDQEGLFTIGGVIVMLPQSRIMENRESATGELATSMVDAVGEAGNLLIGSWDRVFRDGFKGHGHFLQRLPAFIGKPWNNSEEKIGLPEEQDSTVIIYEMTIASYPPFTCAVVFPRQIVGGETGSAPDKEPASEEEPQEQAEKEIEESKPAAKKVSAEKTDKTKKETKQAQAKGSDADETAVEEAEAEVDTVQAQPKAKKKAKTSKPAARKSASGKSGKAVKKKTEKKAEPPKAEAKEEPVEEPAAEEAADETEPQAKVEETDAPEEPQAVVEEEETDSTETEPDEPAEQDSEEPEAEASDEAVDETVEEESAPDAPEEAEKPVGGKVSESIRKMAQSPATLPGESLRSASYAGSELLSLSAGDIMRDDIIWADPDETVQQALAKMQQNDTGYILVGKEGVLEGMASRSDVTGAISPYLRSVFAKWRRPVDYATLQIKVKWIMSRPVRTVTPETSLASVMESMCRYGGRAIPVVDSEGQVQGLITVFDILQMLLQTGAGVSTVGKTPQEPPMV